MNRAGLGFGFVAIAAFLYAARFVAAAVFGSHVSSWSAELFASMYNHVGPDLTIAAALSLAVGAAILAWAGLEQRGKKDGEG